MTCLLSDLIGDLVSLDSDCEIQGISNDSRKIKEGDCFIAYPGALVDGRDYILQAIKQGAAAVLYDPCDNYQTFSNGCPCIGVEGLATKTSVIASRYYQNPSEHLFVTGITGTNGKTTVGYMLTQVISKLGHKAAYIGTLGYGMIDNLTPSNNTTPDPILLQQLLADFVKQGVIHLAMEVSSHALVQGRVSGIAFNEAIFTNLSHEHLDYHLTMADYARAKAQLFSWPTLERAIINIDDQWHDLMQSQLTAECELISYSMKHTADVMACDVQAAIDGLAFKVVSPWGEIELDTQLVGLFNGYNLLAVFASAMAMQPYMALLVKELNQCQSIPGRMQLLHNKPCVVIDYSHTPDALEKALMSLKSLCQGKLICVFGCGGDRDKEKRSLMGKIADNLADRVFITNDNPRNESPESIVNDILNEVDDDEKFTVILDRAVAISEAISLAKAEDVVIVAGKGHENYQIIQEDRLYFNDSDVALEHIRKL